MKKNYESPKVEKLEFNYTETIVASGPPDVPTNTGTHTEWVWKTNNPFAKCPCTGQWENIPNC